MNEAGIAEAVAKLTAGKKLVVTTVTTYEIVGGGELKAAKAAKEPKVAKPKGKRGRPKKVKTKIEEAKPKRKAGRPVGSGKKKSKKAPAVKKPKGRPKGTGKKPVAKPKPKPMIVPVPAEVAALINKLGKTKLGQIAKNVKVIKKAYKRNSPIINLCKKVSSSTGKAKSEMYGVLKTAIKALAAGKTVKTEGSATAAPVPATK